jgi:hypothetical protein
MRPWSGRGFHDAPIDVSFSMLFLRRVHGIELLDVPRCPKAVRDGALDYLQFIIRAGNAYAPIVNVLAEALRDRRIASIVDVCSGAGGPWPDLRSALVAAGAPANLEVTLTDLYPNHVAFANNARRDQHVTGNAEPVDIERAPIALPGIRTSFSSFHHFEPAVAQVVLRNLAQGGAGIFIAEVTERSWKALFFMLLAPLFVWIATPRLRPFSWTRFRPFRLWCVLTELCRVFAPTNLRSCRRFLRAWQLWILSGRLGGWRRVVDYRCHTPSVFPKRAKSDRQARAWRAG